MRCNVLFENNRKRGELNAEKLCQHRHSLFQLRGGKVLDDAAMLHDVKTIRQWRSETKVLFDHNDCVALLFEHTDHLGERLHDDRRKPL